MHAQPVTNRVNTSFTNGIAEKRCENAPSVAVARGRCRGGRAQVVEFKDQIEQVLGVLTDENAVCKNFFSKECQNKVGAS